MSLEGREFIQDKLVLRGINAEHGAVEGSGMGSGAHVQQYPVFMQALQEITDIGVRAEVLGIDRRHGLSPG